MLELRPILVTLWRNRLGATLVITQIALTLAIISNALLVINERQQYITRPTGVMEENLFGYYSRFLDSNTDIKSSVTQDLETLRRIPGVVQASPVNSLPMSGSSWNAYFSATPNTDENQVEAFLGNMMITNDNIIETLGVKLVEGRSFLPEEVIYMDPRSDDHPPVTIITKALAKKLFPDGKAVGKTLYRGEDPLKIVGIVERAIASRVDLDHAFSVVYLPAIFLQTHGRYLVRTEPGQLEQVMKAAEKQLLEVNPQRILRNFTPLTEYKTRSYKKDSAMVKILSTVTFILAIITLMGIVGLTNFWVSQRRKQIGTRRALGATKAAITRYFLLENLIISGIGVIFGSFLAFGFNSMLVRYQGQTPLEANYLLISGVILLSLGLLAALLPAIRAAATPPALATRSV